MKFKFHHMNLCTDSLARLTKFYQTLFDLGTINDKEHTVVSGNTQTVPTRARSQDAADQEVT